MNKKFENYNFVLSNYENLFSQFNKDLPTLKGEMLDSQYSKIHRSIYSNRYDQKQMNDDLERLLTNKLEPLVAMASTLGVKSKLNLIDQS
jgi:mannosylglycerate hydrolase